MTGYSLLQAATNDLEHIAAYTVQNFGVEQAIAYRDGLIATFDFLADNPRAARERHELSPPVRIHRYKSHLILYIIRDDAVLIVRLRHGREDWVANP